jgi:hypothetical protein
MSSALDFRAKQALTPKTRRVQVLNPNLGLYLDRSPISMPDRAMSSCLNCRVRNGEITNERIGYASWLSASQLPDPITMVDNFRQRSGTSYLMIGTKRDVCFYNSVQERLDFLNGLYDTGTATISAGPATTVLGAGGADFVASGIKAGDYLHFDDASYRNAEGDWYEVDSVTDATHLELVSFDGGAKVGVDYTIRVSLTATDVHSWSAVEFPAAQPANEDTWYGTNGTEVVKWNGVSSGYTIVTGLGFTCRMLAYYKNMLHYGDITVGGERRATSIRSSDVAQPEVMSGGTSAEVSVVNGTDRLMRLEILGDHLVCLAERSVNVIEFVGDPIGYTIRTALQGIGPFSERLVVNHGDYIEFVAHDRAYRFDGVGKSEMGSQVFRELLRTTDPTRAYQSHAYRDEEEGEVLWVIAATTDTSGFPETSYAEHYIEPVGSRDPTPFTSRQLPSTAMGSWTSSGVKLFNSFSGAENDFSVQTIRWDDRSLADDAPITVFGDKDGKLYILNSGQTRAGAALWSIFSLGRQVAIDGQIRGLIRTYEPYLREQSDSAIALAVNVFDGAMDTTREGFEVATFQLWKEHDDYKRRAPMRIAGRYVEPLLLAIGDTSGSLTYSYAGYELELVPGGKR